MIEQFTQFWDWVDKRDIEKHVVTIAVFSGTVKITEWAMAFANAHPDQNGAMVIAAVAAPYMALQAAAIKYYFDARSNNA